MAAKGKTVKYISAGQKWIEVCFFCPLEDCVPESYTCPIKVALDKKIQPARMVEIEQLAGENQPTRFRELIYKQQMT